MKHTLMMITIISLLIFSTTAYADCRGCCSHHGGVVCSKGVTKCADGTTLSAKCRRKGCNKCGYSSRVSSDNLYAQVQYFKGE